MNCSYPECKCPNDGTGDCWKMRQKAEPDFPDPKLNRVRSYLVGLRADLMRKVSYIDGLLEETK